MATVLKSPVNGKTVEICARNQHEFNECKNIKEEKKLILSLADNTKSIWDNTTPDPVVFEWESDSEECTLEISESESFENVDKYTVQGKSASVYNLKKDTEYFWKVNGSNPEKFRTDSLMPRWIKVSGIGNVRDIGGRRNAEGKRIKQGLIYRGYKLEDSITENGRQQLRKLGIKTELDLRKEIAGIINHSFIGEDVEYIQIPCSAYDEFISFDVKSGTCKKLIETLSNPKNYPIYFHCHGGADRTGTLAFLLDAILGLDDETMLREYEMTMLSSPEQKMTRSRKGKFKPFLKYITKKGNKKASLRDNTMTFIANAGVSQATISQIRANLLED